MGTAFVTRREQKESVAVALQCLHDDALEYSSEAAAIENAYDGCFPLAVKSLVWLQRQGKNIFDEKQLLAAPGIHGDIHVAREVLDYLLAILALDVATPDSDGFGSTEYSINLTRKALAV